MSTFINDATALIEDVKNYLGQNAQVGILIAGRKRAIKNVTAAKIEEGFVVFCTKPMEGAPETWWKFRPDQLAGIMVYP